MFENIKADVARYYGYGYERAPIFLLFESHQIWATICYRYGNCLARSSLPRAITFLPWVLYHIWWKLIQLTAGIYISAEATIGPGLYIGHFGQIFIGSESVLGSNCNISQCVTLGYAHRGGVWGTPKLGDRVYLAPGAKVIGPITLSDGVVVGANAVMSRNAPENTIWAGIPARLIGHSGSAEYMGTSVSSAPQDQVDETEPEPEVERLESK